MIYKMFLSLAGLFLDLAGLFEPKPPKTSIADVDIDDGDGGDWWANTTSFPPPDYKCNSFGSTALN
jgi:hypothetical protein